MTANDANDNTDVTLAGHLVAAILSQTSASASNVGATVTVTDTASGSFSDTSSVTNGGHPGGNVLTVNGTNAVAAVAADPSYDATGFTALTVGATAGNVSFTNVGAGVGLSITASQGGSNVINYLLKTQTANDTLSMTVGVDGAPGTGTAAIHTTVATTGIENLVVASQGEVTDAVGNVQTNRVLVYDAAAKTVTITGDQAVNLDTFDNTGNFMSEGTSAVTKIDASGSSGAVDLADMVMKAGTQTILGGSGMLTATGGSTGTDVVNLTTGSGGGNLTLGGAGAWAEISSGTFFSPGYGAYAAGNTAINLSASTKVADTVNVQDGM